jgi:hypothetical protein
MARRREKPPTGAKTGDPCPSLERRRQSAEVRRSAALREHDNQLRAAEGTPLKPDLAIMMGYGILIVLSALQLMVAYVRCENRRRHDIVHDPVAHWPFVMITVVFPILVSAYPLLAKTLIETGSEPPKAPMFKAALEFASAYFVTLVTVEFGVWASTGELEVTWRNLLVVSTVLDLCGYIFSIFVKSHQFVEEPHTATFLFLFGGVGIALLASLYTISSVNVISQRA